MTTTPNAARQRAYKARKQAQGLVRVAEWVHKDDAALVRSYAEFLRTRCYPWRIVQRVDGSFAVDVATTAQDK